MQLRLVALLAWPISTTGFNGLLHPLRINGIITNRHLFSKTLQQGRDSTNHFAVPELFRENGPVHSITFDMSKYLDFSFETYNWKTELLTDFSHLMLDLFAFLTPERAILRLANVMGRMSTLAASEYNQDSTTLEEFSFQVAMLVISAVLCSRSLPSLSTIWFAETTFRDRATYMLLFRPTGMSWLQYRTLLAVAGEWITVPPNTVVSNHDESLLGYANGSRTDESNDYLHWLYIGDAEVQGDGESIQYLHRSRGRSFKNHDEDGLGLLDPLNFSRLLEKRNAGKPGENRTIVGHEQNKVEIKSGRKGATILRLNVRKLLQLMEDDERVEIAIQSLVLRGLHHRLGTLVNRITEDSH